MGTQRVFWKIRGPVHTKRRGPKSAFQFLKFLQFFRPLGRGHLREAVQLSDFLKIWQSRFFENWKGGGAPKFFLNWLTFALYRYGRDQN